MFVSFSKIPVLFSKVPNVSFQEGFLMMVHNRKVGEEHAFSPKKSLKWCFFLKSFNEVLKHVFSFGSMEVHQSAMEDISPLTSLYRFWMVVSTILNFYLFLGEMIRFDEHIFSTGLKPPPRKEKDTSCLVYIPVMCILYAYPQNRDLECFYTAVISTYPKRSMYGIFTYIHLAQKSTIHVGKYTIHGSGQIIATSSDLTPNGVFFFFKEHFLISGVSLGWWNIIPFGQMDP